MFHMSGAVASNDASFSLTAAGTLNSQELVRQYSSFSSTYLVVVNTISPSLVSYQEHCDDTVSFEVIPTLLPSPLSPVTPLHLVSSTACPVANLVRPPFLQTALPQLAAANVESHPSLSPISEMLPSFPSSQPSSCTNFVSDTPLLNQISKVGRLTSRSRPRAFRRLLPKVTKESVKPSVSTENAYSYKGLKASGMNSNSNSSTMCEASSFSHLGGPATYCQTSSSTCIAASASVKVPASVTVASGADIKVTSNMMLPTKAKETSPSLVEKENEDVVCNAEKHVMHMQPSTVQTKASKQNTNSQCSDSYSVPKPNGSPVHCTINNSDEFHVIEPCSSTGTQDSTGVFVDGENESLSNYSLSGKEGRSLCIDDSVNLEQDFLKKHNPTRVAIEQNLPALDRCCISKKSDRSLHVDSATDHSGHQSVKTVLDGCEGCTTLNSGEPIKNFHAFGTYCSSEKNETHHLHGAVNDSKCHLDETVLDACITMHISAGMTVGNENSQDHRSCSALQKNSLSQVIDRTVTSSSSRSHGRRPDTHINSHNAESISVDRNVSVQEKEVCHLVWQETDIDSEEVFSFSDIGCEREKAEVQGEANSCSDNLKFVDSNRQPESKGAKSSFVRRKQPVRACKCLHSSAGNKTAVLEQEPQKEKKLEKMHLIISVPNCIGRACVVVMGRLNEKMIKPGHVNLTTVKDENLFMKSRSLEVKLFPGKIISVARYAKLQDVCDQPSKEESAEQTQGDNLSKLLEERRAYISQLHSVFQTTDHSSI
ncbi:uncharacterized protein [Dermacentor andersoni]|uniref:uncharacterized protein n=1 Tax=Dermacentor andersoni TaxID=34620 RepID=UPI0021552579|nr:uncharacterized protein LOC126544253 [Dermacentor andersoni]XP_050047464.1 uncharacterized protein LOC126544253 [Dermacentor andersoni]